jgi:hypothetical protein
MKLPVRIALALALTVLTAIQSQAADILNADEVLPELRGSGIKATVTKLVDPRFEQLSYPEDRYYLDISFGKLTPDQFKDLHARYGGRSQVKYDPKRIYNLLDFLDPAMQAVANQVFVPKNYDTEFYQDYVDKFDDSYAFFAIRKNGIASFTNCWNTTWEILKLRNPGEKHFMLYWPGRETANEVFNNDTHGEIVAEKEVKNGDVLMIEAKQVMLSGATMLQHTALIINSQLVFEKTDSSENDAYRISLRKDVLKKYAEVFNDEERVIEYRRIGGAGKTPLPSEMFPKKEDFFDGHKQLRALTAKKLPDLKIQNMSIGCELGMGGGCDPMAVEAVPTKLVIWSKTGRGILSGDKADLERFQPLKGK